MMRKRCRIDDCGGEENIDIYLKLDTFSRVAAAPTAIMMNRTWRHILEHFSGRVTKTSGSGGIGLVFVSEICLLPQCSRPTSPLLKPNLVVVHCKGIVIISCANLLRIIHVHLHIRIIPNEWHVRPRNLPPLLQ